MIPLPEGQQPAFDAFVQFIGHVKDPALLPGSPEKVIVSTVCHFTNKAELIKFMNITMEEMLNQQGMLVARLDNPKLMVPEHILSVEYKLFVPMWNIRYIETKLQPITELPRVEEPGVPLLGQGVETKELKPS